MDSRDFLAMMNSDMQATKIDVVKRINMFQHRGIFDNLSCLFDTENFRLFCKWINVLNSALEKNGTIAHKEALTEFLLNNAVFVLSGIFYENTAADVRVLWPIAKQELQGIDAVWMDVSLQAYNPSVPDPHQGDNRAHDCQFAR